MKRDTESGRSAAVSHLRRDRNSVDGFSRRHCGDSRGGCRFLSRNEAHSTGPNFAAPGPTHAQADHLRCDADYPALSPDGKFVAYVTGRYREAQRLMLQDLNGGQAIEISKVSIIEDRGWSPDGTELAVNRLDPPHKGTFVIPRLSGSQRLS